MNPCAKCLIKVFYNLTPIFDMEALWLNDLSLPLIGSIDPIYMNSPQFLRNVWRDCFIFGWSFNCFSCLVRLLYGLKQRVACNFSHTLKCDNIIILV